MLVGELGWATARVLEAQDRAGGHRRARQRRQEHLPPQHEPRDPHADRRHAGFRGSARVGRPRARRTAPDLLRRLQANGLAVLSLLDDLLDLARLDAHKIVLNPEPVSVVELVREVLASLEIESRGEGSADAASTPPPEALGPIQTDRFRLRQILVNLVANAVKFTDAGSITVSLRVDARYNDDEQWTIDITDTGIGIAPDQHARLFEPFEQANASIARVYGGNGLGLALSRRLAEQLGGALVLLHSAPGEGTTFRLTLAASSDGVESRSSAGRDGRRS